MEWIFVEVKGRTEKKMFFFLSNEEGKNVVIRLGRKLRDREMRLVGFNNGNSLVYKLESKTQGLVCVVRAKMSHLLDFWRDQFCFAEHRFLSFLFSLISTDVTWKKKFIF